MSAGSISSRKRTGAAALIEALERAGTEVVFGYPGGNVVELFDRLPSAKFRFLLARHEQGAVHAADGYARATGRPGVVLVTSGPGATNAITGLATANVDGVPLVLVSGQVPLSEIGTDAFQEADMTGICRGVTKHSFLVQHADEIPETVAAAFYIATHGKPGAVVIDLPRNVQEEITAAQYPERISLRAYHPECAASPREVTTLAKMLNAAKRPVIYAGGGVIASGAAADLKAIAERAEVPVVTTLMGTGAFPTGHPLFLGMGGIYGAPRAKAALGAADFILALGVRFSDRVTDGAKPARAAKIVHVDCDPSSIDKNVIVNLGITADIKDLLTTVSSRIKPADHRDWLKSLDKFATVAATDKEIARSAKKGSIHPAAVIDAVTAATKGHCLLVTDVGQHQIFAARRFPHSRPRHFLTSGGMGTMGFGIPAAIGAAIAKPDHKVVAVVGDGGAQMTGEELTVAAAENLPITFIVFNNNSLGMIRQMQKKYYVGDFTNPDFVLWAKACGLSAARVTKASELDKAVARAIRAKGPYLLEVMVDEEAMV